MIFAPSYAWTGSSFPFAEPRAWQREALERSVEALRGESPRGVVRAIMGSGKAALAAELCFIACPGERETIVVSAPTRALVRQLSNTIRTRLGDEHVGRYYSDEKQPLRPVVVVCLDSLPNLFRELEAVGRSVGLWIADEVHRTETDTVAAALEILEPELRIGLTATPYRSGGTGALDSWTELVYEYGVKQALEDRVVVPWKIEHWTGAEVAVDIACLELAARGVELGPGVINANTIADAENFSRLACEYGLRTETIHSGNTRSQNDERLELLRTGSLQAVVHVSMLQEGVDLPWLRWLLLRRNTSSTVRFAQEVGRVLRAAPGKDYATIFDPLELFASLGLTHEACLSGGGSEEEEVDPVEEAADELLELFEDEDKDPTPERILRGLSALEVYLRRVVVALDVDGILEQTIAPRSMRKEPPSEAQVRYAGKLYLVPDPGLVRGLPEKHREILAYGLRARGTLNRGALSDLISILVGLRRAKRWPELVEIMS